MASNVQQNPFATFQFVAEVIDGKILEFPKLFNLQCNCVKPLGMDIVKQYSKTQCILAKRVFLIYCSGQVFGSSQFSNTIQFVNYVNNSCNPPPPCFLTINGCLATIDGCLLSIPSLGNNSCGFILNGCKATINGCTLNYLNN